MRLRHRLLVLPSAVALTFAGLAATVPGHALAGSGASQNCANDGNDVPILTAPVTLGIEAGALTSHALPTNVMVCFSTSSWGYPGSELTGGAVAAYVGLPGTTAYGTDCGWDGNSGQIVTVACGTRVSPAAAFTPGAGGGGTLTVSVPLAFCLGTSLTGPSVCGSGAPTVGATGVVVGTFGVTGPPPGYSTGIGLTLTGLTVVVGGVTLPLNDATTQAGANPNVVGANTGAGLPFCAPLAGCFTLPLSAWVGTQPISAAGLVVAGIPVPLPAIASQCLSFGMTCPAPY
ncbi:MAG TPA: hypothetical protein VFQ85_08025 [Mycobacteriales bacterium]|jgi:hypothetical protein|nr:hypothetical protein [Mycobacteriales bacterium]